MVKLFKIHQVRETDCICSIGAKETRSKETRSKEDQSRTWVRQARLDRQRVCRAVEQPAARQTRPATDRQRTHERRAVEQPEARQARLERLRASATANAEHGTAQYSCISLLRLAPTMFYIH